MDVGGTVNGALRKAILASSGSARVRGLAAKHGLRLGASRFVAGEDLDACVAILRSLNDQGLHANTTLLGEDILEEPETHKVVEDYLTILQRLHDEELRCNVAVKLTHLGLDLDEELAFENVRRLVERAAELGNSVRIDMEYSALVDPTLRIYGRLREAGLENVGTVLQAYLYRTPDDLESLLPLAPNLRLVKGAYLEPESVAYPKKEDVDAAYLRLVERSLTGGGYTAIATHDERAIEHALAFAEREGIGHDRFELQMLYGVRPQLQLDLAARGYKVLVAAAYGPEWFRFFMRRLAERPANLGFVVRNLVRR